MADDEADLSPQLMAMIQVRAIEAAREYLASRAAERRSDPGKRFTRAQFAVARLMMAGSNGKEIARYLQISHRTVEVHRSDIFEKLGVRTLPQAIAVLFLIGLTPDYSAPGAISRDLPKLQDLLP